MCVKVQLPTLVGGANGKAGKRSKHRFEYNSERTDPPDVAYIDTEGTFRPDRIRSIAEGYNIDPEMALENIVVARAYNSEHQMDLILEIAARFAEERGIYKLLVSQWRN